MYNLHPATCTVCDDTCHQWPSIGADKLTPGGCYSGFQLVALGLVSLMRLWKPETARAKSCYRAAEKETKRRTRIENRIARFADRERKSIEPTPDSRRLNWPSKFERWPVGKRGAPLLRALSVGSSEAALPKDTWSLRAGCVLVRGTFCWPAVGAALQKPEQEARSGP